MIVLLCNNENHFKNPTNSQSHVVIYNLKTHKYNEIATTAAWNWQQGARLSWLDAENIIFNTFNSDKNRYEAKIINVNTLKSSSFPYPVQHVFSNQYYLSISYEPLQLIRPDYGYNCYLVDDDAFNKNAIHKVSIDSSEIKKLVDIKDLHYQYISKSSGPKETKAKINHVLIAPNGTKFIFLYRYFHDGKRNHVLFLYDLNSGKYNKLLEKQVISHYCWMNNFNVLFWGIVNGSKGYYLLDTETGNIKISNSGLGDGHPHMFDEYHVITDTYPDKHGLRKIFVLNIDNRKVIPIAEVFHSPFFRAQQRCDPHPSLSNDNTYLQIDTISFAGRNVVIFKL